MNQENLGFLKDTLKFHGFGDKLNADLEANIRDVKKEFSLPIQTKMNEDTISATLHFRKSSESDIYFFNRYDAKLEKPGLEPRQQTFYLDNAKGFTMKEAYNMLDGRSVFKELKNSEGEMYKAWNKLDLATKQDNGNFKMERYGQGRGYDIREVLSYYPIKELDDKENRQNLSRSLERGNLVTVNLEKDGVKQSVQIAADPKNYGIKMYTDKGVELSKTEKNELMLKPQERRERIEQRHQQEGPRAAVSAGAPAVKGPAVVVTTTEQKKATVEKREGKQQEMKPDKKTSKKETVNKAADLLPKKRTSKGKGMSLR